MLRLEETPPLGAPLRFLVTSPWFAVAAALLAVWSGPHSLANPWSPQLLATVHLFTLGTLSMTMVGALFQLSAVLGGRRIPFSGPLATVIHAALTVGVLLLASVFLFPQWEVWRLAMGLVGGGLGLFAAAGMVALARADTGNHSIRALRLAVTAVAAVTLIGLLLLDSWETGMGLPAATLPLHLLWAGAGWVGILVAATAWQVVPMFQITPPYPEPFMRWMAPVQISLLTAITLLVLMDREGGLLGWMWLVEPVVTSPLTLFALITLRLQARRRRRRRDITVSLWRTGMISLVGSLLLPLVIPLLPRELHLEGAVWRVSVGLFLVGFTGSVITGMLYKIVPFLLWLHLNLPRIRQGREMAPAGASNMKVFLPDQRARLQERLHLPALAAFTGALAWPPLLPVAGLMVAASWALLGGNLLQALAIYRRRKRLT